MMDLTTKAQRIYEIFMSDNLSDFDLKSYDEIITAYPELELSPEEMSVLFEHWYQEEIIQGTEKDQKMFAIMVGLESNHPIDETYKSHLFEFFLEESDLLEESISLLSFKHIEDQNFSLL